MTEESINFAEFQMLTHHNFNKNIARKIYNESRKVYIVNQMQVSCNNNIQYIYQYYSDAVRHIDQYKCITMEEKILEENEMYIDGYYGEIVKLKDNQDIKRYRKILSRKKCINMKIIELQKEFDKERAIYKKEVDRMYELMVNMQNFDTLAYRDTIREIDEKIE